MSKINKSNPEILNESRDYIDGLMLSDGSIQCVGINTGYYEHSCKYNCWLDMIFDYMYKHKIESKVNNGILYSGGFQPKSGSLIYKIRTRAYIEFKVMRNRWYKEWYDIDDYNKYFWHFDKESGDYFIWKKIIPKDICLTPECILNLYIGDGNINIVKEHSVNQITLATYGFLVDDVFFLSELISDVLDIECSLNKYNTINISKNNHVRKFFDYIKDCTIPSCYDYKFPKEFRGL